MVEEITTTKTVKSDTSTVETPVNPPVVPPHKHVRQPQYNALYQLAYLLFGLILGLLALRFLFKLAGANGASGFVVFLYGITDLFMAPFRFIFPVSRVEGSVLEWPVIAAMLIYALIEWALVSFMDVIFLAEHEDTLH